MQITGQIVQLAPTTEGGYTLQDGGYIYTFMMTVRGNNGDVTGEIGTKSQQYPLNIGDEIIVEVKNTKFGTKLKKINPGYGQPQANNGPAYQAPMNNAPPRPAPPQQRSDSTGMLIIAQVAAKITAETMSSGVFKPKSQDDIEQSIALWFKTIVAVGTGGITYRPTQAPAPAPQAPAPTLATPPDADESIPF